MRFIPKISKWFMETTTWTKALLWLVASQIVYFIMISVTIPAIENHGNDLRIFDLMPFGYSHQYAITLLEGLGEQGRHIYLTNQIPLDLIYPGLMGVTGALFISLLSKKTNPSLGVFVALPIIASIFDYLENFMIAAMLLFYPNVKSTIVTLSSIFTMTKSILTTVYLVLLLVLFSMFFYKVVRFRRKKSY